MGVIRAIGKGLKTVAKASPIGGAARIVSSAVKGDIGGIVRGAAETIPGVALAGALAERGGKKVQTEQATRQAQLAAQLAASKVAAQAPVASQVQISGPQAIGSVLESGALPQEVKEAIQARQAGLAGFSAPELAAQRAQMALQQQGAEAARARQIQTSLARSGVRGGAAAAATGRAAQLAAQEKAAQAQELFLRDIGQKEAARQAYEKSLMGGLDIAQRQQFMEQAAKIAEQQLQSAERGSAAQIAAAEQAQLQSQLAEAQKEPGFLTRLGKGIFG